MASTDSDKPKPAADLIVLSSLKAADQLIKENDFAGALRTLDLLAKRPLSDEARASWAKLEAVACLELGMACYQKKDRSTGAEYLRRAVNADRSKWFYRINAGLMAYNHYQYELAIEHLDGLPDDVPNVTTIDDPLKYRKLFIYSAQSIESVPRWRIEQELKRCAERLLRDLPPPIAVVPAPGPKIRLGYLCSHFGVRNTNGMIPPMFANHDRSAFEIFCYSVTDRMAEPQARQGIIDMIDHWRDISELDDDAAADLVRRDRLHFLIDLDGITSPKIGVIARHPAHIVGGWWHNWNTNGMRLHEFVMTDAIMVPPEEVPSWAEEVVHLPDAFEVLLPKGEIPEVASQPPCLSKGYVTFGVYSAPFRINPTLARLWARILEAVPGSRLVMRHGDMGTPALRARCVDLLTAAGVDIGRVELIGGTPLQEMLGSYRDIDVHLDTWPMCGGNTTLDGLMQGVPLVTLVSGEPRARMGATILLRVGCPELVTYSAEEYVAKTIELAGAPERLIAYRATLRDAVKRSPLHQPGPFMRGVEAALKGVLARKPPPAAPAP